MQSTAVQKNLLCWMKYRIKAGAKIAEMCHAEAAMVTAVVGRQWY
jgi:hypothetical protein